MKSRWKVILGEERQTLANKDQVAVADARDGNLFSIAGLNEQTLEAIVGGNLVRQGDKTGVQVGNKTMGDLFLVGLFGLRVDAVGEEHLLGIDSVLEFHRVEVRETKLEGLEDGSDDLLRYVEGLGVVFVVGLGELVAVRSVDDLGSSPKVLDDVVLLRLSKISSFDGRSLEGNVSTVLEMCVGVILHPFFLGGGGEKLSECVVNID